MPLFSVTQFTTHRDYGPPVHNAVRFFPALFLPRLNFAYARGEIVRTGSDFN